MNKSQLLLFVIFVLTAVSSCAQKSNSTNGYSDQSFSDTIHFESVNATGKLCKTLDDSYFKRFGIVISKYYVVMDSLAVDLNRDSFVDTVIILSPIPLEPIAENYDCDFEKDPKRLLVEIINNRGKSKIRNVYSNLISNVGGVLSHYNGIIKTKDGFKIVHQAGAKYSWLYTIEFSSATKDKLTLTSISKTCSYEGEEKNLNYYFKNQSIERINIPDTLQSNCDCDKYWLDLEKK
jgi:hypothetical protein